MRNVFAKITIIIVAILVFFIFPILYFSIRQDSLTQHVLSNEANGFVDLVSTKGYITKDMYEVFLTNVDAKRTKLILDPTSILIRPLQL